MDGKEDGFNQIKYQNQYNKDNYDRIQLMLPKGKKEKVKQRAYELGKSVNGYINDVIDKDIESKQEREVLLNHGELRRKS